MTRPTVNQYLLNLAEVVATRSTCSRLQVGAVIAAESHVLSCGYNGAPSGLGHCHHDPGDDSPCLTSVHAEANAIIQAARHGVRTADAALYLTHAPCLSCSGLILNAGIRGVFFSDLYRSDEGVTRLKHAGLHVTHVQDLKQEEAASPSWKWW